jgi:hypothetical protein
MLRYNYIARLVLYDASCLDWSLFNSVWHTCKEVGVWVIDTIGIILYTLKLSTTNKQYKEETFGNQQTVQRRNFRQPTSSTK